MYTVKSQKMRICFHRSQIVDRHNLDIGAPRFNDGPQNIAPDAPKSIDGNFDSHGSSFDFY